MRGLEYYWYRRSLIAYLLWPVAWMYCQLMRLRRGYFKFRNKFWPRLPVPVVIIGNISVGGTGKTPMVIWLANQLRSLGLKPGIVSRGYGGKAKQWPQAVSGRSDPLEVGDEPVLLATRVGCPVYVGPKRMKAARRLLKEHGCDVLISDDGLQHYKLQRDIEIAMIDSKRRFGNGFCLPAGPLREPAQRLRDVDYVVVNGLAQAGEYAMGLTGSIAVNLLDRSMTQTLEGFRHQVVHAVAGIATPKRFFDMLSVNGIQVEEHPFPDHHRFSREDIEFGDDLPVLMTEKDAVKCKSFVLPNVWVVPISAVPDKTFAASLLNAIKLAHAARAKRSKRRG